MKSKLVKIAKDTNLFLKKFIKKQKKSELLIPMEYGLFSGGKKIRSKIKNVFETQKQQVLKFNNLSQSNKFPEIICTDLNDNAFSESYKNLSKNRLDTFKEKGQGFGSTYQFPYFPLRIDYIFQKGFNVIESKHLWIKTIENLWASDHHPVYLKCSF